MGEQIGIILMKPIRVLVVGLIAKSLFLSGLLPLQIITYFAFVCRRPVKTDRKTITRSLQDDFHLM